MIFWSWLLLLLRQLIRFNFPTRVLKPAPPYSRAITFSIIHYRNKDRIFRNCLCSCSLGDAALWGPADVRPALHWCSAITTRQSLTSATQQVPMVFLFCFLKQSQSTNCQHRKSPISKCCMKCRAGKEHGGEGLLVAYIVWGVPWIQLWQPDSTWANQNE